MSGERLQDGGGRPSAGAVRWSILLLTCGGLFGQFFAFDIPSALNVQMKGFLTGPTGISEQDYAYYFSLLYSVYSVPNVALPLVLGIAVDRCGCRLLIFGLSLCVVMGHVVFSAGMGATSWPTMLAGRVLFGIGGESLQVAQNCLLFRWFKGREVAFALGLNLSIARAGSVLNDVVSPWVAGRWGIVPALWLGAVLCLGSFACNVWSVVLDRSAGERVGLADASGEEDVSLREVLRLPKLYWLLTALCVILYCGILPFNNIASAFFVETRFADLPQAEAQQRAGNAMSLLFMASAFGTPPFGALVDLIGMRTHFLLMSSVLLTVCYAAIFVASPAVSMLCLGTVYTVFAGALWPSFALTVPQRQLGTAYGVATALQNAGLAVVPLLVGHLQSSAGRGHFAQVMRLFLAFGVAGTAVSAMIYRANRASSGVLDLPSGEAERSCQAGESLPLQVKQAA